jgi:ribosomal protein S18 acetylase RimI-like enzyme
MVGPAAVSLRAASAEDEAFLYDVYASTRSEELAPLAWDTVTAESFLRMQFSAQDRAYRQSHPSASFAVVLIANQPAGRLYVDRRPGSIHVIDIALLPQHRGGGVGRRLLEGLLEEGRATARPVTLNVLRSSPAIGLYRRLGFVVIGEDDVYLDLEWRAQVNTAS